MCLLSRAVGYLKHLLVAIFRSPLPESVLLFVFMFVLSSQACIDDFQCDGDTCCAVSLWIRGLRLCTPMGQAGDSCHPRSRKVSIFVFKVVLSCCSALTLSKAVWSAAQGMEVGEDDRGKHLLCPLPFHWKELCPLTYSGSQFPVIVLMTLETFHKNNFKHMNLFKII